MKSTRFLYCVTWIFILSWVTPASAQCVKPDTTLFYCATKNNKEIILCDAKSTINYSFGRKGTTPELALKVPRAKATTTQWSGIGRSISYSVEIPNGKTVYSVFFAADRMSDDHPITAGVQVTSGGRPLATVACVERTIVNNLEGVNLKPTE